MREEIILCGANAYEQKYYFNEKFQKLPEQIKEELQILCILFTEDIGGIFLLEFNTEGRLCMKVEKDEMDLLYDDIGSDLKIKEYQRTKTELFQSLELYYQYLFSVE